MSRLFRGRRLLGNASRLRGARRYPSTERRFGGHPDRPRARATERRRSRRYTQPSASLAYSVKMSRDRSVRGEGEPSCNAHGAGLTACARTRPRVATACSRYSTASATPHAIERTSSRFRTRSARATCTSRGPSKTRDVDAHHALPRAARIWAIARPSVSLRYGAGPRS